MKRPLLVFIAIFAALSPALHAVTTVTLTSGEADGGLSLNLSQVVLAWNAGSSTNYTVQGVTFVGHLVGAGGDNTYPVGIGSLGASANDVALRGVMGSLAWDGDGSNPFDFTFSSLTPNARYQFDVLQAVANYAAREQAILANGVLEAIVNVPINGSGLDTTFTTTANGSGQIELLMTQSQPFGGTGNQDGAVFNGLVITAVVPEPSTYAAIFGAIALGAAGVREHRRHRGRAATAGAP